MAETVVYVSKTGFAERYARMLAERLGTRALPLDEAVKSLGKGGDVVIAAVPAATGGVFNFLLIFARESVKYI